MFCLAEEDPRLSRRTIDNQQVAIIPVYACNKIPIIVLAAVLCSMNNSHIHVERLARCVPLFR
jgi:hypothetical protein